MFQMGLALRGLSHVVLANWHYPTGAVQWRTIPHNMELSNPRCSMMGLSQVALSNWHYPAWDSPMLNYPTCYGTFHFEISHYGTVPHGNIQLALSNMGLSYVALSHMIWNFPR